jgi:hypothetical protein
MHRNFGYSILGIAFEGKRNSKRPNKYSKMEKFSGLREIARRAAKHA